MWSFEVHFDTRYTYQKMNGGKMLAALLPMLLALLAIFPVKSLAAPETGHRGLDPTPLVEWFGGRVTSGFRDPSRPYHVGVDFGVGWGAPIPSTWEGVVAYVGWYGDFGNTVIVQNDDWQMRYCHLSRFSVQAGQEVQTGTVVGLSGNTGVSTGAHLHYEVRYQGLAVDPMTAPGVASDRRPVGDYIELRIFPTRTGANATAPWQASWVVVQWQDPDGAWRDVEGWQGTLDEIANGVGRKTWWVAEPDLGKGPFRWMVYRNQADSTPLARSGSFYLPDGSRAVIVVIGL